MADAVSTLTMSVFVEVLMTVQSGDGVEREDCKLAQSSASSHRLETSLQTMLAKVLDVKMLVN